MLPKSELMAISGINKLRYTLPLMDLRNGADLGSSSYIGHVSELTSGLATVDNELSLVTQSVIPLRIELTG